MTDRHDGGPAFPLETYKNRGSLGMTMRQYYKAAALTGIMSDDSLTLDSPEDGAKLAIIVGRIADCLIAEDEEHD